MPSANAGGVEPREGLVTGNGAAEGSGGSSVTYTQSHPGNLSR